MIRSSLSLVAALVLSVCAQGIAGQSSSLGDAETRGKEAKLAASQPDSHTSIQSLIVRFELDVESAKTEVERLRPLVVEGVLPILELDQAELKLRAATEKLEHARQQLVDAAAPARAPADPPPPPAPAPAPTAPPRGYDAAAGKLPPRYEGDDPSEVYRRLARPLRPRGEFETTPEYLAAMRRVLPDETFAFPVAKLPSDCAYDADESVLHVSIRADDMVGRSLYGVKSATGTPVEVRGYGYAVKTRTLSRRHYAGRNAFGVSARVTDLREEQFGVLVREPRLSHFSASDEPGAVSVPRVVSIPMPRDRAKAIKPHVRALVVGVPDMLLGPEAMAVSDEFSLSATLSNPTDLQRVRYWALIEPREIWVYNYTTGVVLLRHVLDRPRPAARSRSLKDYEIPDALKRVY